MKFAFALAALTLSASAAELSQEPDSFTVTRSDLTNQYAVLSWTLPTDIAETVVYRGYGEGGPWAEVADVSDATTRTDEAAPLGVPCWYKIAFAETDEESTRTVGDMCAAVVTHRRCQLLERDWNDMTQVKDGVTVIWHAGSKIYNNGDGVTRSTAAESAADAFDNNLKSHPNIAKPSSGRQSVGVDLGGSFSIGFVRCYPRNASSGQYYTNFDGLCFYGSNSESSWYATTEPAVTAPLSHSGVVWHEVNSTNRVPYRYVYAWNPGKTSWSLTVCELQFYGWPSTACDGYAVGAVDLSAAQSGSTVVLSWKDNNYNTAFNVERSVDGGEWTAIASGLSATEYVDSDVSLDGTEYVYRVVSVNGEAYSYSATARCVPYEHGDGTGLHRSALFPFFATEATEMDEYTSTGAVTIASATLDEARPIIDGVEGTHTNVYVTWTGKLIVPFAGSYTFTAEAIGMVAVYVDGNSVCGYSAGSGLSEITSAATSLSAGEHDIRVLYWQGEADSGCTLYWGGAVETEVIPESQLKPVVPTALSEPWEGGRVIMSSSSECFPGDVRINDDGTFDLSFAGADSRTATCAFNYMWRSFKGDFVLTTKLDYILSKISGEKAGIMVSSGLSSTSPFEAFFFRSNDYDIGLRSRRSVDDSVSEPFTVEALGRKKCWAIDLASTSVYIRLKRKGTKFTYMYRTATSSPWITAYEHTDDSGLYGDTVYVGPVASNVVPGDWTESSYRRARYAWRFSELDIHSQLGLSISIK